MRHDSHGPPLRPTPAASALAAMRGRGVLRGRAEAPPRRADEGRTAGHRGARRARREDRLPGRLRVRRPRGENAGDRGDEIPHRLGHEAVHRRRHPAPRGRGQARADRQAGEVLPRLPARRRDHAASSAHAHVGHSQLHGQAGVHGARQQAHRARGAHRVVPRRPAGFRARRGLSLQQFRVFSRRRDRGQGFREIVRRLPARDLLRAARDEGHGHLRERHAAAGHGARLLRCRRQAHARARLGHVVGGRRGRALLDGRRSLSMERSALRRQGRECRIVQADDHAREAPARGRWHELRLRPDGFLRAAGCPRSATAAD